MTAIPAGQRTGYQCLTGGDACPGHPSKWMLCGVDYGSGQRCPSRLANGGVVLRCQDVPGHDGNHVTVREQWSDDHDDAFVDDFPGAEMLVDDWREKAGGLGMLGVAGGVPVAEPLTAEKLRAALDARAAWPSGLLLRGARLAAAVEGQAGEGVALAEEVLPAAVEVWPPYVQSLMESTELLEVPRDDTNAKVTSAARSDDGERPEHRACRSCTDDEAEALAARG